MGGRGGYSGTTANSSSKTSPLEAFRDNARQLNEAKIAATKANASVLEFTDITGHTSKWYSEGTTWRDKPNSMESIYSKKSGTYKAEYKRKKK